MKVLLPILLCLAVFGCKKDQRKPAPQVVASGSISYKVNGAPVTIDNANVESGETVFFAKQLKGIVSETRYLLNAQNGPNTTLGFTIIIDSLHQTNYHYDSSGISDRIENFEFITLESGQGSGLFFNGDFLDLTISSYKNGRVSGTFNGKQTTILFGGGYGTPGAINITEGIITNVPVTY